MCNGYTFPNQQRAVETHPSHEVHSSPAVQQKRGHINVAIMRCDVEGCETTLRIEEMQQHTCRQTNRHTMLKKQWSNIHTRSNIWLYKVPLHQTRTHWLHTATLTPDFSNSCRKSQFFLKLLESNMGPTKI